MNLLLNTFCALIVLIPVAAIAFSSIFPSAQGLDISILLWGVAAMIVIGGIWAWLARHVTPDSPPGERDGAGEPG